jgi:hypothetical protein
VSYLSQQLVHLLQSRQEKELENGIEIFFALAKENARYAAEVFLSLPEILSKCWSQGALSDCLVYSNVLVRTLSDTAILSGSRLSSGNLATATIVLVKIVNHSSDMFKNVSEMLALREITLNGLHLLLVARRSDIEPILERLLSPRFRGYFFPSSTSLLASIQSAHFNKKPDCVTERNSTGTGSCNDIEDTVLILPQIMRCEWQFLFEVSTYLDCLLDTGIPVGYLL